jgi:hypothetical protein
VVVPKNKKGLDGVLAQAASARAYTLNTHGQAPPNYFVIGDGPVNGPKQ